jgi:hypothetical protein
MLHILFIILLLVDVDLLGWVGMAWNQFVNKQPKDVYCTLIFVSTPSWLLYSYAILK